MLGSIASGLLLLTAFCLIELRVAQPMINIRLFRSAAFGMGNLAGLMSSVGRGGLQFMLIIWLQGIWLPLRGYEFESTPLWAAIYMLPVTVGFLVAGPLAGSLSDRFGARPFTVGGMLLMAASFVALVLIPVDFDYWVFAVLIFLNGLGGGIFTAPNTAAIMSSVPAAERGAALVRQMLAFSRRQTLISETLDLNHVAAGMEQMLRRTLGEDVEIEMRLATPLWSGT